jgi:type VI secretion system secreted protein VgrG
MLDYRQEQRPVQIHTPLGPDAFTVTAYYGEEFVSCLFHYRIELRSTNPAIDLRSLTGQSACLEIALTGGQSRFVHGVIGRASQTGIDAGAALYALELRPWLWLLTMNADCRIFQNLSTPDIVRSVFSGLGFTAFADRLESPYQPREYCVQYGETSFDFVARLLEEEGIFYFFEHTQQGHTLVLADSSTAWSAPAGTGVAHVAGPDMGWQREDAVTACALEQAVTVGEVAATDYNFQTPSTSLLAKTSGVGAARSVYGYPGRYLKQRDGETRTGIQLESLEASARMLRGQGTCRGFAAGARFTLEGHARADTNVTYALLRLEMRGTQTEYTNTFEAVPADVRFRPPVRTRRPSIAGTQTATVTGKAGEETWTDSYGRIKVKFHWDRSPAKDENSSCWVRVAQGWAGKSWGSFFLPRIGQEVVVSFLDGDPDRPLVTGCVYNAEQVAPYPLPADQTKSTIKSNSSHGGGGWNEVRFEDKAGKEELYLRAQKDMQVEVLNDQSVTVGHQRTVTIQKADDLLTVSKGSRTISVKAGNETHTVHGTRTIQVDGNEKHTNGANSTNEVKGTYTLKVSGNLVIEAGGSVTIKAGGSIAATAGTSIENSAGTTLTNKAGAVLTNKAGTEQVVDGGALVVIKGGMVKIN